MTRIGKSFPIGDTVEEKIIELQKQKREIADAIISEDASLLKKLTPEDIDVLLS